MMRTWRLSISAVIFILSAGAEAQPSLWDAARDPRSARAERLLNAADRARVPADPAFDGGVLEQKLNERSAIMIQLGGGEELGDPRLLYLLGDCLVHATGETHAEGRDILLRALKEDPDNPLAATAWFNIAIASSLIGDYASEQDAYDNALEYEWSPEARAQITLNRASSFMAVGDLNAAIANYQTVLQQTRSEVRIALAKWGLGVALDRTRNFPAAIPFIVSASRMRFGPNANKVAIDLEGVTLAPNERHYYRALSQLALASQAEEREITELLQSSKLLWLNYVQGAAQGGPWTLRARQHLRWISEELDRRVLDD